LFKRVLLPISIVIIGIVVFITLKQTKPEKRVRQQPEKIWRVNTLIADFQTISPQIRLYGRVETPRNSYLKSALVADVTSTSVLEGNTVKRGQVLVELDNTDATLLLAQRQAELTEINTMFNSEQQRYLRDKQLLVQQQYLLDIADKAVARAQKLEQTKLVSQASLDDSIAAKHRQAVVLRGLEFDIEDHPSRLTRIQSQKKRVQALLQQAKVDLSRTKITAPFDGRISQLNVSVGDRLRAGDNILSIYDINNLEVRAQIPGRYIQQVRKMMMRGDDLTATYNSKSLKLNRLSGSVKMDSGGIDGLFRFTTDEDIPVLGKFVEIVLTLSPQENVIALPSNALYGLNKIYIIKEGYLQAIDIQRVGEYPNSNNDKMHIVRSNLISQGDIVVATQLPNAITGLRVEALGE